MLFLVKRVKICCVQVEVKTDGNGHEYEFLRWCNKRDEDRVRNMVDGCDALLPPALPPDKEVLPFYSWDDTLTKLYRCFERLENVKHEVQDINEQLDEILRIKSESKRRFEALDEELGDMIEYARIDE